MRRRRDNYQNLDGGENWLMIPSFDGMNFNNLYFFNISDGIIIGDNGDLYITKDSATTLNKVALPVGNDCLRFIF
jgi:photosystem II stability/assembly factor-like uncharacterized protein